MIRVDLDKISGDPFKKSKAISWCYEKYGPALDEKWNLRDLRYLEFSNERDATLFILKWS